MPETAITTAGSEQPRMSLDQALAEFDTRMDRAQTVSPKAWEKAMRMLLSPGCKLIRVNLQVDAAAPDREPQVLVEPSDYLLEMLAVLEVG